MFTLQANIFAIHKHHPVTIVNGSYETITGEAGNIVEKLSFDPWGRRRNPLDWSYDESPFAKTFDRGYTGHQRLDIFGLINMNGRVYDPWLGRMLSPDPFVQAPGYSQNYNRYSYAFNNPLKYTDPSGYEGGPYGPPSDYAYGPGAASLGMVSVYYNYNTGQVSWTRTFGNSGFATTQTEIILYSTTNEDRTTEWHTSSVIVHKDKEGNVIDVDAPAEKEGQNDQEEEHSESEEDYPDVTEKFNSQLELTRNFFKAATELFSKLSFDPINYVRIRSEFFIEMVKTNSLFDIKNSSFSRATLKANRAYYYDDLFTPDDFGNYNFGVAAKAFGYSLTYAKFGAGMYQVFKQNGQDWGNWSGFFDFRRDSELIERGYYHF